MHNLNVPSDFLTGTIGEFQVELHFSIISYISSSSHWLSISWFKGSANRLGRCQIGVWSVKIMCCGVTFALPISNSFLDKLSFNLDKVRKNLSVCSLLRSGPKSISAFNLPKDQSVSTTSSSISTRELTTPKVSFFLILSPSIFSLEAP